MAVRPPPQCYDTVNAMYGRDTTPAAVVGARGSPGRWNNFRPPAAPRPPVWFVWRITDGIYRMRMPHRPRLSPALRESQRSEGLATPPSSTLRRDSSRLQDSFCLKTFALPFKRFENVAAISGTVSVFSISKRLLIENTDTFSIRKRLLIESTDTFSISKRLLIENTDTFSSSKRLLIENTDTAAISGRTRRRTGAERGGGT